MEDTTPIVQLADMPVPPSPNRPPGFDKTKLILPFAILIAGLMVSTAILYDRYATGSGQNPVVSNGPAQGLGKKADLDLSNAPVLGDAKAPVTIVEYGDFQCPYCKRYFESNQAMFLSDYVNTGKAKFVWKDYAFLGPESIAAAEAARCANDQGKFWQYHDYLYSHQGAENSGAFSKPNLKKFAVATGLNAAQFNTCLDSGKYTSFIQQEAQAATSAGVSGTPATFINGQMVVGPDGNSIGAAPYAMFKTVIDHILAK